MRARRLCHCADERPVRTPLVTNAQPLNETRTVTDRADSEKITTSASPSSLGQLKIAPGGRAASALVAAWKSVTVARSTRVKCDLTDRGPAPVSGA